MQTMSSFPRSQAALGLLALLALAVAGWGFLRPWANRRTEMTANLDATDDDPLLRVARRVPGFGGMFIDRDGRLAVYLLDPVGLPAAEGAIADVYGAAFIPAAGVYALPGQYSVLDLNRWYVSMRDVLALPAVSFVDLDEGANRLSVGVEEARAVARVEQALRRLDIPRDVVNIEKRGPILPAERRL
jgi:hypothetical protein